MNLLRHKMKNLFFLFCFDCYDFCGSFFSSSYFLFSFRNGQYDLCQWCFYYFSLFQSKYSTRINTNSTILGALLDCRNQFENEKHSFSFRFYFFAAKFSHTNYSLGTKKKNTYTHFCPGKITYT